MGSDQGAWVDDLVRSDTGEVVTGHVADAVAAGLDRIHLDFGQLGEDVGDGHERRPVELQVLAGREVAIAAVVRAGDVRERAQLAGREQTVRDRDAQHRRVLLEVQAVLQPQRAELVLRQLARQKAPRLVAKLRDALCHNRPVEGSVAVH